MLALVESSCTAGALPVSAHSSGCASGHANGYPFMCTLTNQLADWSELLSPKINYQWF